MGHNSIVSSHPKSTRIPRVNELLMGPPDLGCHIVFYVELPVQRRLCLIFVKSWVPKKGTLFCGVGLPDIHESSMG